MKFKGSLKIYSVIVAFLVCCGFNSSNSGAISLKNGRLYMYGHSIVPPKGKEWDFLLSTPSEYNYIKTLKTNNTAHISTRIINFTEQVNNIHSFMETIRNSNYNELNFNKERSKYIKKSYKKEIKQNAWCVKFEGKIREYNKSKKKDAQLIRDEIVYYCLHPEKSNVLFKFKGTITHTANKRTILTKKVSDFLKNIKIEKINRALVK